MKKLIIISLITAVVLIWSGDYLRELLSDNRPGPPECQAVSVIRGDIALKISGRGVVKPKRIVNVISNRFGEVQQLMVREGDAVKKGQRLIRIKPEPNTRLTFQDLREKLQNAAIQLKIEKENLDRQHQLFSEGLASKLSVETAEKAYKATARGINGLRTRAKIFEKQTGIKIDISGDEDANAAPPVNTYITAPIAGTVVGLNVRPGDLISADPTGGEYSPPAIIADISQFYMEYKASELDIGKIKVGQTAEVRFDSLPDTVFKAEITRVAEIAKRGGLLGMTETMNQNKIVFFSVTLKLKRSDIRLKIGITGRVNIIYAKRQDIRLVPVEAVIKDGDADIVYTMDDESFYRREVVTGVSDANFIEITSELPDGTLLCRHPLRVIEWEALCRAYDQRSMIEKILN